MTYLILCIVTSAFDYIVHLFEAVLFILFFFFFTCSFGQKHSTKYLKIELYGGLEQKYARNHLTTSRESVPYLTPLAQTALLRRVSIRTSGVPISFMANLRISLMARGALLLKELRKRS